MPRKSTLVPVSIEPRGYRLEPPASLSEAEKAAFIATVMSVRPTHFALEDMPLLVAYAAATVQERAIVKELDAVAANAEDADKAKDRLRTAHGRTAGTLTRLAHALRLGAMARNPSRHSRPAGTVEAPGPLPWEFQAGEGKAN